MNENMSVHLPLVCTRGVVVFPDQEVIIDVGRAKSVRAVEEAQENCESQVILVAQKDLSVEEPDVNDVYSYGTLCHIKHMRRMDGYLRVKFRGISRVELHTIVNDDMMSVTAEIKEDVVQDSLEEVALVRKIAKQFEEIEAVSQSIPREMINELAKGVSAQALSNQIAQLFPFTVEKRQELKGVISLVDARHEPTKLDQQMVEFLHYYNLPLLVVGTKLDKIPKSKWNKAESTIKKTLKLTGKDRLVLFSAVTKQGKEDIWAWIEQQAQLESGAN